MIVYHSSNVVITKPDIDHSRKSVDFSTGFYLTTIQNQALLWANKQKATYGEGYINRYSLDETKLSKYNVKEFKTYSEEWLDFIQNCRNEKDISNYDIVIGPITDDRIYDTLSLYIDGLIKKETVIEKLKIIEPNNQICIRNNEAINDLLKFEMAEAI